MSVYNVKERLAIFLCLILPWSSVTVNFAFLLLSVSESHQNDKKQRYGICHAMPFLRCLAKNIALLRNSPIFFNGQAWMISSEEKISVFNSTSQSRHTENILGAADSPPSCKALPCTWKVTVRWCQQNHMNESCCLFFFFSTALLVSASWGRHQTKMFHEKRANVLESVLSEWKRGNAGVA